MEKSKKMSFTSIAIVVLAILLTVSLTMGGTLAWFANQNQAGTTLTMGNAVGVAVVDETGTNGSMDRLSFQFNTGRNGELMLPGTQIDPDVRALIAKSNTNVILRAVVTFEVTLDNKLDDDQKEAVAAAAGAELSDDGFLVVPSSVGASLDGVASPLADPITKELYLLNELYTSFFATLQRSALYNGWVYRESNVGKDNKVFEGASAKAASSTYYVAGKTQYSNTPITVDRSAGLGQTQYEDGTQAAAASKQVLYNAFYFRGWATQSDATYTAPADTQAGLKAAVAADGSVTTYDPATYTYKLDNRGIDGYYRIVSSNGSIVRQDYLGGGKQYFATRDAAVGGENKPAGTAITDPGEYAILEGTHVPATNTFTRSADTLGYREGDYTSAGTSGDSFSRLNVATSSVNAVGQGVSINNTQDSWQSSGVTTPSEDMMCVLNTKASTVRVPLFTTSFILPTSWTQDAFADRSMRLNVTFQVMQADYLASGSSHHCSVELAESRFDDVTIWVAEDTTTGTHSIKKGQPYVKNVADQPDFDNPKFWNGNYGEDSVIVPPENE